MTYYDPRDEPDFDKEKAEAMASALEQLFKRHPLSSRALRKSRNKPGSTAYVRRANVEEVLRSGRPIRSYQASMMKLPPDEVAAIVALIYG